MLKIWLMMMNYDAGKHAGDDQTDNHDDDDDDDE